MKKIALFFLVLIYTKTYSQSSVYKPFCNNPSWSVLTYGAFGLHAYKTYEYQLDTTIGVYTYKKIKSIANSSFALFREDAPQKKVYQYDTINSSDYLYMDFNLNYGDPFNLVIGGSVYSLTVSVKDSILINGCYHNKIELSSYGGSSFAFVEGILSRVNPLNPRNPSNYGPATEIIVWTVCECHNGQFYYTFTGNPVNPFNCNLACSPEAPCSVAIGINEFSINYLDVYPNPTNSILNIIDKQNQFQSSNIEIRNYLGQIVYTSSFAPQINIANLPEGMYFLVVQDKNNQWIHKIIKE